MKSFLRFAQSFRRLNRFSFISESSTPTCQTKEMLKPAVKLTKPADSKTHVGLQSAQPLDSDARVLLIPARYQEGFSGNPARIGRSEEGCDGRNILRLADAAERGLRLDLFLKIAS